MRRNVGSVLGMRAAVVAAMLVLFTFLAGAGTSASPAAAQECNPVYGCTTTTVAEPPPTPTCQVSASAATSGQRIDVVITDVPDGTAIELTLAGRVVASGVAGASAEGVTAAAGGFSDVPLSFIVPDLPPGNYTLVATGAGFTCECLPGTGFRVLSANLGTPPTTGGSGGNLARTGSTILGLLLFAAGLIVIGRTVVARSRRAEA